MKAPISVCIIVKNEPLLEDCLKSVRDYVNEIVIVDTGSTDNNTIEVAKKYADIFEIYTACNNPETGLIEDFSQARQRSFDLATQPWVIWCDADDIIVGGEHLLKLTEQLKDNKEFDSIAYLFRYEYAYNENNECVLSHFRERLVYDKTKYHWVNPVHEVLVPNDGVKIALISKEDLVFQHKRQYSNKPMESGRNLRILRRYVDKVGESDARQLYYLGLECCNNGLVDEAISHLTRYIEISGWEDERVMACLKLADIYQFRCQYENVLKWGFKAIEIKENWSEGYFALAKAFYFLALQGGPNELRNWQKCVHFAKTGLNLPPTQTLLFVNPLEREVEIHKYLNMAFNKIGDVQGALNSVNIGLKKQPTEPHFINNKKLYEAFIYRKDAVEATNKLKEIGEIDQQAVVNVAAILNKQPLLIASDVVPNKSIPNAIEVNTEEEWHIPNVWSFDGLPLKMTDLQLQAAVIMMWKQFMLHSDFSSAVSFLEHAPNNIKNSESVITALKLTKSYLNSIDYQIVKHNDKSLDIIFFAGDGVEIWTPDTVKNTGIGGSELMLLEQAKRLAALGHNVRVYNSCGEDGERIYDGVKYYQTKKFKNLDCDVLIVSRRADMLGDQYNIKSKLKLLWVHDVCAIAATNELLLKADRILALSEWHKQNLIKFHNIHPGHIIVTRNGIDSNRFNKQISRNKYKCVNSSSPDRSWPILLDVWSQIKAQVPQAELHLFYGFKNWMYAAQFDSKQMDLINRLQYMIKEMKPLGVVYHDRVNQEELSNEFLTAGAWIHPTWFTETSCITAMEAQAAGLRMVTSNIGALQETAGSRAILLDGEWTSPEYQKIFIDHVVSALTKEDESDRIILQQYAKDNFSLDTLATDWEKMFYQLLENIKINPIVPYQPTTPYR